MHPVKLALAIRLKEYSASRNLVACCISYAIFVKNIKLSKECLQRFELVSRHQPKGQKKDPNFILRARDHMKAGKVGASLASSLVVNG